MGRLDHKVAFITGAARGQGRAEAVRLAQEGADIIAIDIAAPVETNIALPATPEDLAETVRLVEKLDRRIYAAQADVRDYDKLKFALDEGVAELGRLDIVIANAGLWSYGLAHELTEDAWQTVIDVDLTGVWHTTKAAIPILKQQGTGGSIIITSSSLGLSASPHVAHYVAAKHGTVGLMRTLALELATDKIRVNTANPTTVNTDLIQNAPTYELFAPELPAADRTREVVEPRFTALNALAIPWVEPEDVASAVAWLASDEARYVTASPSRSTPAPCSSDRETGLGGCGTASDGLRDAQSAIARGWTRRRAAPGRAIPTTSNRMARPTEKVKDDNKDDVPDDH